VLTTAEYVASIRRDAGAVLALAREHADRLVPWCPGWTVQSVADHLDAAIRGPLSRSSTFAPATEGLAAVLAALAAAAVDVELDHVRGAAQECGIHRWDAEAAVNGLTAAPAIDEQLACDGIDEFFESAMVGQLEWRKVRAGEGQRLHFHRTDGPGEWLIVLDEHVDTARGGADVELSGPVSELLLWLWNRVPPPEVIGDTDVLDHLRSVSQH